MKTKILASRWKILFQTFADNSFIEKGFDDLVGCYLETHRHYHNLWHVQGCLNEYDRICDDLSDKFCIETAIWFHDVIYNPQSTQNEEMSADYASSFLNRTNIDPRAVSKIDALIRLTKHPSNPSTSDEKHLIDIDLTTLGAKRAQYDKYELAIAKEYAYVPAIIYKAGRRKMLNAFLDSEHIFKTRFFRQQYETKARANIARAIQHLRSN